MNDEATPPTDDTAAEAPAMHPVRAALPAALQALIIEEATHGGQTAFFVRSPDQRALLENLRFEQNFEFLKDVTAIDFLGRDLPERFQLVYVLYRLTDKMTIRVHAWLPEEVESAPSMVDLWDLARWGERETHDMFGITFDGNPDLRRLLMPEDYPAFPLLKDYPLKGRGERRQFPLVRPRGNEMVEEAPLPYPVTIGRGLHTPEYIEEVKRESKPRQ